MVTFTSLPALSLQHTEVELYSERRRNKTCIRCKSASRSSPRPRHLRGNEMRGIERRGNDLRVIVTQPDLTRTVSDINGDFSQKSQNFPTTGVFCAQADEVLIGTGCRRLESKN